MYQPISDPITSYAKAIDYLLSFADFERSSSVRREAEQFALTRITSLLERLDRPQDGPVTVHVAGSKGKGSTAAMIESVCRAAGLKTGLFTSPDLHGKTERIRIDGAPLSEDAFTALIERLRPVIDAELAANPGRLSTFEILTMMGFVAFRDAAVDVQVVEVGLGGRLDTTNVFREKAVAVVTALSREHTEVLGDSMEKIAAEKAGIVTAGTQAVVLGPQRSAVAAKTVREYAADVRVSMVDVEAGFRWSGAGKDWLPRAGGRALGQWIRIFPISATGVAADSTLFLLPLLGLHQIENAATALAAVDVLRDQGLKLPAAAVHTGLATVDWPARLEVLATDPTLVIDCAHNEESLERVLESLPQYFDYERLIAVLGVLGDKDLDGMAGRIQEAAAAVVVTRPDHPRAADIAQTRRAFEGWGGPLHTEPVVADAVHAAMKLAGPRDLVCVLGSLFTAAEVRDHIKQLAGGEPTSARADR